MTETCYVRRVDKKIRIRGSNRARCSGSRNSCVVGYRENILQIIGCAPRKAARGGGGGALQNYVSLNGVVENVSIVIYDRGRK